MSNYNLVNRRRFMRGTAAAAFVAGVGSAPDARAAMLLTEPATVSFFRSSDTHYCADAADPRKMNESSASYNAALVEQLNKLPGTAMPAEVGGGALAQPAGVIHVGDIVDNGDKGPTKYSMAEREAAAFVSDWGLNGTEGRLRWAVREVHGNHDSPHGDGPMIGLIKQRNEGRDGLTNLSDNRLHYSWDWGDVHFVALGIVVGDAPLVTRKRRYAPLGSLPFLEQDLRTHVGSSGRTGCAD